MKTLATLSALLLLTASAFTQTKREGLTVTRRTPEPPPVNRRIPVIWIDPAQGKLKPMTVQSVDVDIKVRGHLATTTLEMAFYNPNARVLEGELIFPLGEGQSIAGYALEVEGKLRQSVVVEKERGREIFEEVVRRGIDPGLAELTKGNVFRTRVYPIPAKGVKRLAVTFEQELGGDGKGFRYLLPLHFTDKIGRFHARAEVVKQEDVPMPDAGEAEVLTFEKWRDSFVAELTRENATMEKPLAFTVPKLADRPQVFLASEKLDPARLFFHAHLELELPAPAAVEKPGRVAVFYDASGSAEKRDRKQEIAFLESWLKSLGSTKVDLVVFRNDADKPILFDVKDGDASALRKALEDLPLDGGTSLGAVNVADVPEAELAVLISDGFSNFGHSEPSLARKDDKPVPLFAIHAATMVDGANLDRLARKTGGRVVNLITAEHDAALAAMGGTPFQFIEAKVISGKVSDLVPGRPEPATRSFTVAGRCEGKAEIELSFGRPGKVAMTRRITLNPADALDADRGDFVRRAWAQRRIAELALDPKRNESAITALGREHRIVTAGTSLLVLDRIEDYVRHRLEPPEAELREQYLALLAKEPKDGRDKSEAAHLDDVAKQWAEFKAWHEKRHPWLETVLKPAAEREAALYAALSGTASRKNQRGTLSAEDAAAARMLAEKAKELTERWAKEGRDDNTRTAWIKDATNVMLAVDALRQRRLELVPDSDASRNGHPEPAAGAVDRFVTSTATAMPRLAASAAAPPAPAAPSPVRLVGVAGGGFGAGRMDKAKKDSSGPALSGSIEVKAWDPDTPYLKKLRKADDAYAAYLKERRSSANSSAFFLDCADFFREEKKDNRLALRVLSNLAELELENAPLLRILAYRLQQIDRHELAVPLFEEVLKMRGEEPQSRRDLALCLARMKQPDLQRAADLLWEVVKKNWDGRFPGIEIIALHELNDLVSRHGLPVVCKQPLAGFDERFRSSVPVDLRVVLTWDADNTDMDLWVVDPSGEICIYNHNRTQTGGHMSQDFTRGYGPEVFTIRRALPGTYTVKTNYYGNSQQKLAGATTVQVEFQTAYSQPGAQRQAVTRRLQDQRDVIEVGKFVFKPEVP